MEGWLRGIVTNVSSFGNGGGTSPGGAGVPIGTAALGMRVFHSKDLGVHIAFAPPDQPLMIGASGLSTGAVVWQVDSGTALAAGIQTGDVVLSINGKALGTEDDVRQAFKELRPGKSPFRIRRGTQPMTIEIDCPTCK